MIDREKVISGLEYCIDQNPKCRDCPYFKRKYFYPDCEATMKRSALELLKEQEKIINEYHKADAFLAAHGWEWKHD